MRGLAVVVGARRVLNPETLVALMERRAALEGSDADELPAAKERIPRRSRPGSKRRPRPKGRFGQRIDQEISLSGIGVVCSMYNLCQWLRRDSRALYSKLLVRRFAGRGRRQCLEL